MSRRASLGLSVVCTALLLPVTACTADDTGTGAQPPARRTHTPAAGRTTATASPAEAQPSVEQPPRLDPGETPAGRLKRDGGNAVFAFDAGKKGDVLIVAIRCQGKGTATFEVRPVGVTFTRKCLADEVGTDYNEMALSKAHRAGTVTVTAPSSVRWSVTVGRGPGAEEDLLDT
ncbi:hypothetical protein ACIO93_29400 [Streptomyces sp. NPDC087903]|uniref:hypothetical protein n=1 Tax=Streptomyces sp. NPDC087903 TaxID=3365819 RepID=UPI0038274ECF